MGYENCHIHHWAKGTPLIFPQDKQHNGSFLILKGTTVNGPGVWLPKMVLQTKEDSKNCQDKAARVGQYWHMGII